MRNNKLHFSSKYKSFIVLNGVDSQLTGSEISGGFVKKGELGVQSQKINFM
jgi:hypothetical protein